MRLAIKYDILRFMLDLPEQVQIIGCESSEDSLLVRVKDAEGVLGAPDEGDYEIVYRQDEELGIVVLDSLLSLP